MVLPLLVFSGVASAQQGLSKEDQKCVNSINKGAQKVASAQGKVIAACIKDGSKGKLGAQTIEDCTTSGPKGKVAKAISKIKVSDCLGEPNFPPIDTNAESIGQTMVQKEIDLIHAIFGSNLDAVIIQQNDPNFPGDAKAASKCQSAIAKAVAKCEDTKLKVFNQCKKDGLKGKTPPGQITSAADLEVKCLMQGGDPNTPQPDPKGKIRGAKGKCDGKLADAIDKKCGGHGLDADVLTPSCAGQNINSCLDQKIECEVCRALNALDGLRRNCDEFDDGVVNESCGAAPPIGENKCVLDPNSSSINLQGTPLYLPPFPAIGAIDLNCGSEGANGKAPCDCVLQELEPINITGIGFLCFTPTDPNDPCPPGEIDCDGGNALDVDMDSDHNIGTCTSNADCAAQCTAHCGGMGATLFNAACEGFCKGGTNNGNPCTDDSECPGGFCSGKPWHGNICGCDCLTVGGSPSGAGGLECNLGANIDWEVGPPCGDGDILMAFGTRCIPLTTETVSSQFHNWNNTPGADFPVPPFTATGNPIPCQDLAASTTSGLAMVGTVNFFDTTIGDYHTNEIFTCF